MKKYLFLLLSFPFISMTSNDTPQVKNVQFKQSGQQVIVNYDLVNAQDWQTFDVELFISKNNRSTYEGSLKKVKGDLGFDVKSKNPFKDMVFVEGGTFQMGSNDGGDYEKPIHSVTVSSFYMSKYETTVAEFKAFVNATKYTTNEEKDNVSSFYKNNHPVINVSWNDAKTYCDWKTKSTGKIHRLPTEAEWEYAAQGGKKSNNYTYAGSNDIDEVAWYRSNSKKTTHKKGTKAPNELGLYDMSGNVYEWCEDWYKNDYYQNSPSNNPIGPNDGTHRIIRGGSWRYVPKSCRTAYRNHFKPRNYSNRVGFRIIIPQ